MELDKRLLFTSLTEIGVRGVNVLPTKQNKTKQNLKTEAKTCRVQAGKARNSGYVRYSTLLDQTAFIKNNLFGTLKWYSLASEWQRCSVCYSNICAIHMSVIQMSAIPVLPVLLKSRQTRQQKKRKQQQERQQKAGLRKIDRN